MDLFAVLPPRLETADDFPFDLATTAPFFLALAAAGVAPPLPSSYTLVGKYPACRN